MMGLELLKPTDPQTSGNSRVYFEDGQAVSSNISISSSEMQSEKTSKEADEVAAQSKKIGKIIRSYVVVFNNSW